jgi:hypothetical protein
VRNSNDDFDKSLCKAIFLDRSNEPEFVELRRQFALRSLATVPHEDKHVERLAAAVRIETSDQFLRLAIGEAVLMVSNWEGSIADVEDQLEIQAIEFGNKMREWQGRGLDPPIEGLW